MSPQSLKSALTLLVASAAAAIATPASAEPHCRANTELRASLVSGGNSAAFVREISQPGVNEISGCFTTPSSAEISRFSQKVQEGKSLTKDPYIYFGFNGPSGLNIELGFAFQAGNLSGSIPPGFRPYMRSSGGKMIFNSGGTLSERMVGGEHVCLTGKYNQGRFELDTKSDSGKSAKLAIDHPLSEKALRHLRARRVTEITTARDGHTLGSFTDGHELGDNSISVTWDHTQIKTRGGQSKLFKSAIDWRYRNRGGRCDGSVLWPATIAKADDSDDGRESRSIKGPGARVIPEIKAALKNSVAECVRPAQSLFQPKRALWEDMKAITVRVPAKHGVGSSCPKQYMECPTLLPGIPVCGSAAALPGLMCYEIWSGRSGCCLVREAK